MTDFLIDIGLSRDLAVFVAKALGALALAMIGLVWTLFLIWVERKIAGRFQDRLGPNRAGPFGIVQTVADAIKIILKEDVMHRGVDRWVFNIAPLLSVMSVLLLWVVVPFTPTLIGVDLSIGVLYLFAVGSLGAIAILMAGWGSSNKFAPRARSVASTRWPVESSRAGRAGSPPPGTPVPATTSGSIFSHSARRRRASACR